MGNTASVTPKSGQHYAVTNVATGATFDDFGVKGAVGVKLGVWPQVEWSQPHHHYLAETYRGDNTFLWRSAAGPNVVYEEDDKHDSTIKNSILNTNFEYPNQRWYVMYDQDADAYFILNYGTNKAVTYQGNNPVRCCAHDPNNLTQQWKINPQ